MKFKKPKRPAEPSVMLVLVLCLWLLTLVAYCSKLLWGADVTVRSTKRGCVQTVYVLDHQTHQVRKLVRREYWPGGQQRPGTGQWGQWQEDYCQPAGARVWRCQASEWPRLIASQEVSRLLGPIKLAYYQAHTRAKVSQWWDFTGRGYTGPGLQGPPITQPAL